MDKRTLIALILSAIVIVVTPMIFRSPPRPVADSTAAVAPPIDSSALAKPAPTAAAPRGSENTGTGAVSTSKTNAPVLPGPLVVRADTITRARATYQFLSPGAALGTVRLASFKDLSRRRAGTVTLTQPKLPLFRYRVVLGGDTINMQSVATVASRDSDGVTYTATGPSITLSYHIVPSGYLTHVRGSAANAPPGSQLLIDLPGDLGSDEADSLDDQRHFAYAYKRKGEDVSSVAFTKLDSTLVRTDSGPMDWVAVRDKYFLLAFIATDSTADFTALRMQGGHRPTRGVATASATAILPMKDGAFAFDLYAGPQSWTELHALGHTLENVNPYGGFSFLRPIVQPVATIVMRVLLWMKLTLNTSYGWVLVIFGITIRLLLWPLNQSAMRTSIKMQRLQPELAEVQKRYAKDSEAQRTAMMKLYQEHGMSPLSPLMGCLPMLLPMPVLYALYFVFQNTIEFRGVSFLWLPDLSLRDPYYITPLVMGASMFVLSWIGLRAAPPAPQAKLMSYMMPVMFTAMFMNFASGLNLYYGVQNLTALPQQWLITRERARAGSRPTAAAKRSSG